MNKILIVEDDIKLRNELALFLKNNGYEVISLTDFNNPINDILNISFDLLLLDIKLPNYDGEYICKELRKSISIPIIIVTSKNTELDEIISINYGADDFISKPYNPQVLLARINRLINRVVSTNIIKYKDITLDINKSVIYNNDHIVNLSLNELKILNYLLTNRGKIISRDEMINYLWDNDEFIDDNTLTVNINRLRNKLLTLSKEEIIITKRSQGYIII